MGHIINYHMSWTTQSSEVGFAVQYRGWYLTWATCALLCRVHSTPKCCRKRNGTGGIGYLGIRASAWYREVSTTWNRELPIECRISWTTIRRRHKSTHLWAIRLNNIQAPCVHMYIGISETSSSSSLPPPLLSSKWVDLSSTKNVNSSYDRLGNEWRVPWRQKPWQYLEGFLFLQYLPLNNIFNTICLFLRLYMCIHLKQCLLLLHRHQSKYGSRLEHE